MQGKECCRTAGTIENGRTNRLKTEEYRLYQNCDIKKAFDITNRRVSINKSHFLELFGTNNKQT